MLCAQLHLLLQLRLQLLLLGGPGLALHCPVLPFFAEGLQRLQILGGLGLLLFEGLQVPFRLPLTALQGLSRLLGLGLQFVAVLPQLRELLLESLFLLCPPLPVLHAQVQG